MKNWFLMTCLFLATASGFAQGKVKGFVTDSQGSLAGATVTVEENSTTAIVGFDGSFVIENAPESGTLVVSFMGYNSRRVPFEAANGKITSVGSILMQSQDNVLGEIVIKSTVIDIAKDRRTPVAVSTIKASEIREKLGSQEFPEILANTPSVYVTKQGGGFGDARINIRGFDQRNIAVMINGVPVNDMENGAVYWSNWAGLSDVTSAMQVQRGLGSSKLAISSVGGTINVITRTSEMKQGGSINAMIGNNEYLKTTASYNTGKMKNGLSASVLLSNTQGSTFANGTKFSGQNYFIAFGYDINEKNNVQLTFTGAPQWHNQRSYANTINDYIKYGNPATNEPNTKYNSDYGYLKGEEFSWNRNFYHKPVASLNWDYKINDMFKLSTVLYGSWGRGGGTGNIGRSPFAYKTADGLVPFNDFYAYNTGTYNASTREAVSAIAGPSNLVPTGGQYISSRSTGFTRRASINSHDWYGGVMNLNTKLSKTLTLDFGLDARTYTGYHFRNINDRLGADGYQANLYTVAGNYNANDINNPTRTLYETYSASPSFNPWTNIKDQEKIEYNNNGYVRWYGAFTQLEYSAEKLSAFVQGAVSQQGFSREDTFRYLNGDPLQKTPYENILGYNAKGGVNYNLTEKMNVFVNAGYYSKQPNFQAVYPNNKSIVGGNLTNEKITGFEAGYGYKTSKFNANLNVYYTSWKDRYQRSTDSDPLNIGGYYDFTGIHEVHTGVELEMNAKPISKLGINAMVSVGDWKYKGNSLSNRYDANNVAISGGTATTLYLDGVKVGDAAQLTASLGANYELVKGLKLDANYRYADKLYASISPASFGSATNKGSLELPSYGLMDAGLSYKIFRTKESKDYFNVRVNVNNVLDEVYISEARTNRFTATEAEFTGNTGDGMGLYSAASPTPAGKYSSYTDYQNRGVYDGVDKRNQVFFGFGRTWNFGVSYNF